MKKINDKKSRKNSVEEENPVKQRRLTTYTVVLKPLKITADNEQEMYGYYFIFLLQFNN